MESVCIVCGAETTKTLCSRCFEALEKNLQPQAIFIDGLGKETSCHLEKMVRDGTGFQCYRSYPTTSLGLSKWLGDSDPRMESVEQALNHRYTNEKTIYINSPVYTLFASPDEIRRQLADRLVRPSVWVLLMLRSDGDSAPFNPLERLVAQAERMGTIVYRYYHDPKVMLHKAERAAIHGNAVAVVDGYRRSNAKRLLDAALRLYGRAST